ncbi:cell division protein ZapA [Halothiobacillus sp. DCM-1]|uniref:cell division protein ZapA n=1 Tax=Halothiobacillus sp. DCM-1 TaxID=3112558 RepID=UPI003244D46B
MSAIKPVTVRILDKDYKIACPPEEQAVLFRTADFLNQEMQKVKRSSQTLSTERVAVLTALNIARELIELGAPPPPRENTADLIQQIDAVLEKIARTEPRRS